jgi:glycosyltransferase involved in cell wall biosynthesis
MTTNITACLVIYNEEAVIRRCLSSIRDVVDEIAVVHDGPCDDRSLAICEEFGCKIRIGQRMGEAEPHRPGLYRRATTEWILQLDADEFLSEEARHALPELVRDGPAKCYAMLWPIWNGRQYTTRRWPYKKVLFRKDAVQYLGFPHEEVRVNGPVTKVPVTLHHQPTYNNLSLRTVGTKWNRWLDVHARMLLAGSSQSDVFPDNAELQPHYYFIARHPLLSCVPLFGYHLLATMALGGWQEGLEGLKVGLYTSAYYAALCVRVQRLRARARSS